MKAFAVMVFLGFVLFAFKDSIRNNTFSALREHRAEASLEPSERNNKFWCADGFDLQNLSRSAQDNVSIAFVDTNRFMRNPNMYHMGDKDSRCKIVGTTGLQENHIAETRPDGNIYLDVPKIIAFCQRDFSKADYGNCWQAVVKHESLHIIGNLDLDHQHLSDSETGLMSKTMTSLRFTQADERWCEQASICSAYRK